MASLSGQLHLLRRAGREATRRQRRSRFETYEPEYRAVLAALNETCGDRAMEDLTAWMVERTREAGRLPTPETVRTRARDVCAERGVDVPDDSVLAER